MPSRRVTRCWSFPAWPGVRPEPRRSFPSPPACRSRRWPYTGKIPGFGDFLAANATYFAIATPGLDRGNPAGSQVEVFRWADFKRVFRKSGGKNSQFGSGMVFKGDTLYVSAPGGSKAGKPQDPLGGKVFGFPIGGKGKVAVPEGASGTLVADDSNLIAGNLLQLRTYDSATMRLKWNVPSCRT